MAASIACQAELRNAKRVAVLGVADEGRIRCHANSSRCLRTNGKWLIHLRSTGGDADVLARSINRRLQWIPDPVESVSKFAFQLELADAMRGGITGEDLDFGFLPFEFLTLLRCGLPVGVEVSLLFGET
jgi:hypothetical protein